MDFYTEILEWLRGLIRIKPLHLKEYIYRSNSEQFSSSA